MKIATSLAEHGYFYGLSALINSMTKNGTYFDKLVVGYRGALPGWLPKMSASKNGKSFTVSKGLEVELIEVTGDMHMVHEKPNWLHYLITTLEPDAEEYCFFDSDLIVLNRMSFFGEWIGKGVAICEDVNGDMPENHPIRLEWKRIAEEKGLTVKRMPFKYYNSGFIGWKKSDNAFIDDWIVTFNILSQHHGNLKRGRNHDRTYPVQTANQDSLNVAYMVTDSFISTIGKEAMGFEYGMKLMVHPIGGKSKPWRKKYFSDFFKGKPPTQTDSIFWYYANSADLQPYSKMKIKWMLFVCTFLKGLSRFYR